MNNLSNRIVLSTCALAGLIPFSNNLTNVCATPTKLRSVVFKVVGGKQVSPSSLRVRGSLARTPSPSRIHPDDGQLPSTSTLASTSHSYVQSETSSSSDPSKRGPKPTLAVNTPRRKGRKVYPYQFLPGQAIFKLTYDKGKVAKAGGLRPHLVISVKKGSSHRSYTEVLVADMSKVQGKKYDMTGGNFQISTKNPDFAEESERAFVKLNKVRTLVLPNSKRQNLLGKYVGEGDMKIIKEKLGIRD